MLVGSSPAAIAAVIARSQWFSMVSKAFATTAISSRSVTTHPASPSTRPRDQDTASSVVKFYDRSVGVSAHSRRGNCKPLAAVQIDIVAAGNALRVCVVAI